MKLVIDFRMHQSSGIGTYIRNIVPFLLDEFELILLGNAEDIKVYAWSDKVKIINFIAPIYSIQEQFEFALKIPPCDVFWSPHFNVPLLPIRAKTRLVTIHDVFHLACKNSLPVIQRLYAQLLLYTATSRATLVLTVSDFSKKEISRFFAQTADKIVVVPCAIDPILFCPQDVRVSLKQKPPLPSQFILYVGNVKPHKNLMNLLLALKALPDVNLVIVGKKSGFITGDHKIIDLLEQDVALKSRVFFTGFVNDADIVRLYNAAEIFVFPSFYEGFGLPPLEAQACGCPVIASNAASLPEVCSDSVLYCDPYDVDNIAEKISTLLRDKGLQQELIEKGLINSQRFNWESSADKVREIMASFIKPKSS